MNGKLVVIDGNDGVGKTTLIDKLWAELRHRGSPGQMVRTTKAIGGDKFGRSLRTVLTAPEQPACRQAQALCFMAAWVELWVGTIRQWLDAGDLVISDRGLPAVAAYQGLSPAWVASTVRSLEPGADRIHLLVVLDLPVHEARARLSKAGREGPSPHQEAADNEAWQARRDRYLASLGQWPSLCVDASQPQEDIAHQLSQTISELWRP